MLADLFVIAAKIFSIPREGETVKIEKGHPLPDRF
jgi:hypothetical protein